MRLSIGVVFLVLVMSHSAFSQIYTINTVAGNGVQGFGGDGGVATSAKLTYPWGVAVDNAGNLYIADQGNNRIRKVTNGVITTVAGNGTQGFSGDDGPATEAQLNYPEGITVDSSGNLYIADYGNIRIRKVTNGVITTVAGNGTAGFSGDGGPAASAQLNYPSSVAVDSAGSLYITADLQSEGSGNRIRKVTNGVITTVAGNGTAGFSGDGGPATSAQLTTPQSVAVDSVGNMYIADGGNNCIRKVTNGVITTVAGNGTAGFSGDNGPATSAMLSGPIGVTVDSVGAIYISEANNKRIRKVTNGVITTLAGTGSAHFSGDDGPATSATMSEPTGIAVDSAGHVYFGDEIDSRIRMLTPVTCAYSVVPTSLQAPAAGGVLTVSVNTTAYCPWTIVGLPSWLSLSGSASGTGSATVTTQVLSNCGATRSVTVLIAGIPVMISQAAGAACPPFISSIANAASYQASIAPGEIVVLYGSGLGPSQLVSATVGSDGRYDTELAGTTVSFNGTPAPMIYASATQVAAIVPYKILGLNTTCNPLSDVRVTVAYQGQSSATIETVTLTLYPIYPGLFTADSTGRGQAAAINQDNVTINTAATPAKVGDVISLYATGEGQTTPPGVDGKVATPPFPTPVSSVSVTIGGVPAPVMYAGGAPGEVAGLMQVNVQIPSGIQTGSAVPVVLRTLSVCSQGNLSYSFPSQDGVTIAVTQGTPGEGGNMAGASHLTAQSSIFGVSSSITGQVAQIGNSVSGQLSISGSPCATSAAFSGTVSGGSALTMNLNESGQVVQFFGTLASDGSSAGGTYTAPSGGCTNGDKGTWFGQRVGAQE